MNNDTYQKGLDEFKSGNYADAITTLSDYLNANPGDATAWNVKGVALAKIGKYQAAVYCYDKALALQPGNDKFIKNREIVARKIQPVPIVTTQWGESKNEESTAKKIIKGIGALLVLCFFAMVVAAFIFGMSGGPTDDDIKFLSLAKESSQIFAPVLQECTNYANEGNIFRFYSKSEEIGQISNKYLIELEKLKVSSKYRNAYNSYYKTLTFMSSFSQNVKSSEISLFNGDQNGALQYLESAKSDIETSNNYLETATMEIQNL